LEPRTCARIFHDDYYMTPSFCRGGRPQGFHLYKGCENCSDRSRGSKNLDFL